MSSDTDVVDLTESPPAGRPSTKKPRLDEDRDQEAEQRRSIMAFASEEKATLPEKLESKSEGSKSPKTIDGSLQLNHLASSSGQMDANRHDTDQEARQRIMDFARTANLVSGRGQHIPTSSAQQQAALAATTISQNFDAATLDTSSNSLLAQLHAERVARRAAQVSQQQTQMVHHVASVSAEGQGATKWDVPLGGAELCKGRLEVAHQAHQQRQRKQASNGSVAPQLSVLSYNLWFREDVEVEARMQAVGSIVEGCGYPDFVCFQEVTPYIHNLLQQCSWWGKYGGGGCPPNTAYFTMLLWRRETVLIQRVAKIPYENSVMGRDLKCVGGSVAGVPVLVGTTHLESPTGHRQLYSEQRVEQCKQGALLMSQVSKGDDVVLAGDMNWGPGDGQPPLPDGWCDAWLNLYPTDPGLTYDPKANPMLNPRSRLRRRLDRAFCRLQAWRLHSMELVGKQAIPGRHFDGRPVLPSDHFGIFLRLVKSE